MGSDWHHPHSEHIQVDLGRFQPQPAADIQPIRNMSDFNLAMGQIVTFESADDPPRWGWPWSKAPGRKGEPVPAAKTSQRRGFELVPAEDVQPYPYYGILL